MHERNDQALDQRAHGHILYGARHSEIGLDKLVVQLETSTGAVGVKFETENDGQVSIADEDPLFRVLEKAWNDHDRMGDDDVHRRFIELAEERPIGRFDGIQRRRLVHDFLDLAAGALVALTDGQQAEVPSLEVHAQRLYS